MNAKSYLLFSFTLMRAALVMCSNIPPNVISDGYFSVPENTAIGTVIFTLKATDTDGDQLTFSTSNTPETEELVQVGPTVNTSLNEWSCGVLLKSVLDTDYSPSSRELYFSLKDSDATISVKILMIITDVNDNLPTFVGRPYRVTLEENHPTGQVVYQISATDPDSGAGSVIIYDMKPTNVDYNSTFELLPNGSIVLSKPLDYSKESFYHYIVSAVDSGNPQCPGNSCLCGNKIECQPELVDFFITVNDDENTPPIFEKLPYIGTVPENETTGYPILKVIAADGDRGVKPSNPIQFSITGSDSSLFNISETDGVISVGQKLDFDTEEVRNKGGLYVFTVTATEVSQNASAQGLNPNNSTSTQVSITVTDVNDNSPCFTSTNYTASVQENTPSGVPITLNTIIEVYDNDQGSNSRFWVYLEKDGEPYHDFETLPKQNSVIQGRSTITITVFNVSILDYEKIQNITFKVIAEENNTNPNTSASSEATVILSIEDINDNSPYFIGNQTKFSVAEDEPKGYVVATIMAKDEDSGDFGEIIFSLEDDGLNGVFNISGQGVIKVAETLDREERSSYTLAVVASDSPKAPENQRRKSTQYIQINVTDVNDNAPIWSQFIPYISLSESSTVGTRVTIVKAADLDIGPNGQIVYAISHGTNGSGLFSVNASNDAAEIIVSHSLIDHAGLHIVQVVATDKGTPPLNATLDLSVFVIDENQNMPVFIEPDQKRFNASAGIIPEADVAEEQPLDSVLYTLHAYDNDTGENGLVEYYVDATTNKDNEYFMVNRSSGELRAVHRLDRESKETYEIEVRARDNGRPAQLETRVTMRIKLTDINDNEPKYKADSMPQILQVTEENDAAVIGQILSALDLDLYPNNVSCYYLYGGDHLSGLKLDKQNRELSLTKKVDRETTDALNIVIKATENCNLNTDFFSSVYDSSNVSKSSFPANAPSAYNSSDESLLWVRVDVVDINDNPPQFSSHDLSAGAVFDVEIGTEVLNLARTTSDRDTPLNARNQFKLLSLTPPSKAGTNVYKDAFVVSANGSVRTNVRFQSDVAGYFLLSVLVYDNDGMNDTASAKIYLISNLERVQLVFNRVLNEVEGFKVSFIKQLSDILNLDLAIEKIQTHTLPDGTSDPTRTDAYIHGRYRDTGQVVPAEKLWQLFDSSSSASFLLTSNGVVEAKSVEEKNLADEGQEVKKLFIIVAAVLAVMVVATFAVLIHMVRLYRRRLRAATTTAYASPKEKEGLEQPGTNKYFSSGNPLFGQEIRELDQEEDKISHNSLDINAVDQPVPSSKSKNFNPDEEQEIYMHITDDLEETAVTDTSHTSNLDQVLHGFINEAFAEEGGRKNVSGTGWGNGQRSLSSQNAHEGGVYDQIYDSDVPNLNLNLYQAHVEYTDI